MRTARRLLISAALLAAVGVSIVAVRYVGEQRRFDSRSPRVEARLHGEAPGSATIALLGDSWVAGQKLDAFLKSYLERNGHGELEIVSFGYPGAVSRRIYRSLLLATDDPDSSSKVLDDPAVRYCVLIAGVNDSATYIGSDFYAHHVAAIAKALLGAGITPVLVELPEYGIEHLDPLRSTLGKFRSRIYRVLFDDGEVDTIAAYRAALRRKLAEDGLIDRVVLVETGKLIPDYEANRKLYENASHLNESGSRALAEFIGTYLVREIGSSSVRVGAGG